MSLKAFHLVFIVAAIVLAFGFAAWSLLNYFSANGSGWDLAWGVGGVAAGVGLVIYERYFLKKFKNVSYV